MSITIGIYDLFSYLIPGMLYLYLVNEILRLFGWKFVDIAKLIQGGDAAIGLLAVILIGLGAYITGHIFESLRSVLLDNWLYHGAPDRALAKIRRRLSHSNIEVGFHFDEWSIYQEGLKARNDNSVGDSERYKADALMMRNFSFGLLLYGLIQLLYFIGQTNNWYHLPLFIIGVAVSYLTFKRAKRFDEWYYRTIYSQALIYGSNLKEFLENPTPAWHSAKNLREKPQHKKKK